MKEKYEQLVEVLLMGGIAVVRTDTLYGLVARADDEQAVAKVYAAKGRNPNKSCIILVAESAQAYGDISKVVYEPSKPTSVLVEAPYAPPWLLRENTQLAHRIPNLGWLQWVIERTGPLIAPSANPEGEPPAATIEQAEQYFGDAVDLYVDGGEVPADVPPSRLVRIHDDGTIERLR